MRTRSSSEPTRGGSVAGPTGPATTATKGHAASDGSSASMRCESGPTVEFNQARLEVKSYRDLTDDWDGSEGRPPSQRAIDESMGLLSQLERLEVVEPKAMLSNDGEIGLYWRTDRCYLEIGVMGDGNWGAYGIHRSTKRELMIDHHPTDKTLPECLVGFLEDASLYRSV